MEIGKTNILAEFINNSSQLLHEICVIKSKLNIMKTKTFISFSLVILISLLMVTRIYTQNVGYFTDARDGMKYKYIQIGNQTWMAENLKYETKSGSACYNNDPVKCAIYGRLYKWEVAKKACPSGWHLPSRDEFDKLFRYLGGTNMGGGKLKETGTMHWNAPNGEATNSSGFTALAGGMYSNGDFEDMGKHAFFITSSVEGPNPDPMYQAVWMVNLITNHGEGSYGILQQISDNKASIRCIKNAK